MILDHFEAYKEEYMKKRSKLFSKFLRKNTKVIDETLNLTTINTRKSQ
tara:strand:+ start:217 stop:360 length:144 start_codon:yes stop_codon:yes gene_type:complete